MRIVSTLIIFAVAASGYCGSSRLNELRSRVGFARDVAKMTTDSRFVYLPGGLTRSGPDFPQLAIRANAYSHLGNLPRAVKKTSAVARFGEGEQFADILLPIKPGKSWEGSLGFEIHLSTVDKKAPEWPTVLYVYKLPPTTNIIYLPHNPIVAGYPGPVRGHHGIISRDMPIDTTVTLFYKTNSGSAIAGVDFNASQGSVTFAPGQQYQELETDVYILSPESTGKSFFIDFMASEPPVAFNVSSIMEVQITSGTPEISFGASCDSFLSPDSVLVGIQRTGPLDYESSVSYTTRDGTALAGVHYAAISGTATFPAGSADAATSALTIADGAEGLYMFVDLSSPVNGVLVQHATLKITFIAP